MPDVVVIGGANADIKARAMHRHQLGTSNPGTVRMSAGGVGRNIAHNLARLGVDVALISAVGRDAQGAMVLAQTRAAGVDVSRVVQGEAATGSYAALLDEAGELVSAVADMQVLQAVTPDIICLSADALRSAKLIVADCNLTVETLLEIAERAQGKLIVEPVSAVKSLKLLQLLERHPVHLATPNLKQIEALSGQLGVEAAITALHRQGLQNLVLHAGAQGAYVSGGRGITHLKPDRLAPVADVTGAGDAATSGLIQGLLAGASLVAAAKLGQALAARVVASTQSSLD